MTIDALRSRIQPVLQQDFDAVREEFTAETGTDDPRAFVRHLREWELIPVDLANSLLLELAVEESASSSSADADDEATLIVDLDPDDEATEMHEEGPAPEQDPSARADEEATQMAQDSPPAMGSGLLVTDPASTEHDRTLQEGAEPPLTDHAPDEPDPEDDEFDPEAETVQFDPQLLDPEAMRRAALAKTPGLASQLPPVSPPIDATGRYEILEGSPREDALGVDFLARDKQLGRQVTWRVPRREPALRKPFAREIRVWTQLDLPGIPAVHEDRGEEGCIVQRLEGSTLRALLDEARAALTSGRPVPPEAELMPLLHRLAEVCEIVGRAHARGVVHGELEAQQVRLLPRGGAIVVGWGLAGTLPGSPVVLPPREGPERRDDPRDDVLGLGWMLHEAWTLAPSSEAPSAPPSERQGPPGLDELIHQAVSAEASSRPSDAGELARLLRQCLQSPEPAALERSRSAEPARPLERARSLEPGLLEPVGQVLARYPAAVLGVGAALVSLWLFTALVAIFW